ncbi:MAG: hypothetical protein ACJA0H_001937 [Francisellaceae bacterium]|jgi:hypothetical protein
MERVINSRVNYHRNSQQQPWSKIKIMQRCLAKGWKISHRIVKKY